MNLFPNLNEIILDFDYNIIDFDDFYNYIIFNYLKFCNYHLNIKMRFNEILKIRFKTYNSSDYRTTFLNYQSVFDFNMFILSKLIEENIINIY